MDKNVDDIVTGSFVSQDGGNQKNVCISVCIRLQFVSGL